MRCINILYVVCDCIMYMLLVYVVLSVCSICCVECSICCVECMQYMLLYVCAFSICCCQLLWIRTTFFLLLVDLYCRSLEWVFCANQYTASSRQRLLSTTITTHQGKSYFVTTTSRGLLMGEEIDRQKGPELASHISIININHIITKLINT